MINKDTVLCCSFAGTAGSFGCLIHNEAYRYLGINYIYKSFSVKDIGKAMDAMRTLGIRGAGITMPFKIDVMNYVDVLSEDVKKIGAANTIVNDNGILTAYNTDYIAAKSMLPCKEVVVLGRGGLAKAIAYITKAKFITRENWGEIDNIRDSVVFNCTPVSVNVDESNTYIDSAVNSKTGQKMALLQAAAQFKLYTGHDFPLEHINDFICKRFHN